MKLSSMNGSLLQLIGVLVKGAVQVVAANVQVAGDVCLQAQVNHGCKIPKINIHNLRGCRN